MATPSSVAPPIVDKAAPSLLERAASAAPATPPISAAIARSVIAREPGRDLSDPEPPSRWLRDQALAAPHVTVQLVEFCDGCGSVWTHAAVPAG